MLLKVSHKYSGKSSLISFCLSGRQERRLLHEKRNNESSDFSNKALLHEV